MHANPYSSSEVLFFHRGGWEVGNAVKCKRISSKDLPRIPIFICKSSLEEIKRISLGFVSSNATVFMLNASRLLFFFCIGALPTTNDFWSQPRRSGFPELQMCVYWIMRIRGERRRISTTTSIFGSDDSCF